MSETCRTLHDVAFSKNMWLSAIVALTAGHYLDEDAIQRLRPITTHKLVDIARKLSHGPEWSPEYPDGAIVPRAAIVNIAEHVLLMVPQAEAALMAIGMIQRTPSYRHSMRLLPGGEYLLCHGSSKLQCYNVVENMLVWAYFSSCCDDSLVKDYATVLVDQGTQAIIVVTLCSGLQLGDSRNTRVAEVIQLDLRTAAFRSLLTPEAPETSDEGDFTDPLIAVDFIALRLSFTGRTVLAYLKTGSSRPQNSHHGYM
ncbi:hypothetical protein Hypma_001455 [Hypsizygus marmoreus]|uniref:Uncharacterized protein n=1 Tax=Hypsizygus marmoreus TaxID=39966 RepID=A0A369K8Z5_HYPMA|nr:hypothetical protein Hypma_001455 [Hypsizygus marmoreus]